MIYLLLLCAFGGCWSALGGVCAMEAVQHTWSACHVAAVGPGQHPADGGMHLCASIQDLLQSVDCSVDVSYSRLWS